MHTVPDAFLVWRVVELIRGMLMIVGRVVDSGTGGFGYVDCHGSVCRCGVSGCGSTHSGGVCDIIINVDSNKIMFFSEINCTNPQELPNASLTFNLTTFGHAATYSCAAGYSFPSGDRTTEVSCSKTGNWTAPNGTCIGGFVHAADRRTHPRTHARTLARTHARTQA